MKRTTYATHMSIWALYAATILSGGSCLDFIRIKGDNKPIPPPQVYSPPTKPYVAISADSYRQEPVKLEPILPSQKKEKNIGTPEVITSPNILSCKERLLRTLYNSHLFTLEAKDQMKRYIEAFDAWPGELRQLASYDSFDMNILIWLYFQYLEQANIDNMQQRSANLPTKQSLMDALHNDGAFNAEEKNDIAYYIENLTIGDDQTTYGNEALDAFAIRKICEDCNSTNLQDILSWIDKQIKEKKQAIENKKRRIEAKIQQVLGKESKVEKCSICQDEATLYPLPQCGHYFHQECIAEWIATNQSCPLCRRTIEM